MHDDDFEHEHYLPPDEEAPLVSEVRQELTLALDVGSAAAKLVLSRVHLGRLGELSNRRETVLLREVLHRTARPTSYAAEGALDGEGLASWLASCEDAELALPGGTAVLTGRAATPANARLLAVCLEGRGRFACALAGPELAAILSAHGSGAVALSRRHRQTVLNVHLGASLILAAIRHGEVQPEPVVLSVERTIPETVEALRQAIEQAGPVDSILFSGGLTEYLFGAEDRSFGDSGRELAHAIHNRLPAQARRAAEGLYATAIGASQLTLQGTGYSLTASRPVWHARVLRPRLPRHGALEPAEVAHAIRAACDRDGVDPEAAPIALVLDYDGDALSHLAQGVTAALAGTSELVLAFDQSPALSRLLGGGATALAGLDLSAFDAINIAGGAGDDAVPALFTIMGAPRSGWVLPVIEPS